MKKEFLIIGGDERNKILRELLERDGRGAAFAERGNAAAISGAEIVVGPVIVTEQDGDFLEMRENQVLVAGKIKSPLKEKLAAKGVKLLELLDCDEFITLNAIPTGEGIIQTAMENSKITIRGSNALILGFGKVGKYASYLFKNLGADVVVATRDLHSEIAQGFGYGYKGVLLKNLGDAAGEADYIINSIPFRYLDAAALNKVKKESLIIDAASAPYGVDFEYANRNGIKALLVPGLPGLVAPRTAALHMKFCIIKALTLLMKD